MKKLFLLFALAALTHAHADMLGGVIKLSPVTGWRREEPRSPGQDEPPFPTLRFVPKDGRNAAIILTLLPNNAPGFTVTNHASLERFNLLSAKPYLSATEDEPTPTVLEVAGGIGVSITSVDPALVGKPVPPGEYRIATSASVLLDRRYLIQCTIFYDEKDSADLHEAMEILLSATLRAAIADPSSTNI